MEKNNKNMDNQIPNFELPEDISNGVYSNIAIITHSPTEFVCDFVQMMPGFPKGKVRSRVIMTPHNAKRLLNALSDNIRKFEEKFGNINEINQELPPINFGTPPTEA